MGDASLLVQIRVVDKVPPVAGWLSDVHKVCGEGRGGQVGR